MTANAMKPCVIEDDEGEECRILVGVDGRLGRSSHFLNCHLCGKAGREHGQRHHRDAEQDAERRRLHRVVLHRFAVAQNRNHQQDERDGEADGRKMIEQQVQVRQVSGRDE